MPPIRRKEPDLPDAVQSLRSISPRLNAITDRANETVRDVEQFLNDECSIGLPAFTVISFDNGDEEDYAGTYLGYVRVGPKYRIAVATLDNASNIQSVKPWTDCSREEKLESFGKLPDLLARIAERAEEQIQTAEKAAKTVADTLAALRK